MGAQKYSVPNWAQALIARGVGLDPDKVAVRNDNDRNISFLQYEPRRDIIVSKVTGEVTVSQDKYAGCRGAGQMINARCAAQLQLAEV